MRKRNEERKEIKVRKIRINKYEKCSIRKEEKSKRGWLEERQKRGEVGKNDGEKVKRKNALKRGKGLSKEKKSMRWRRQKNKKEEELFVEEED